MKQLIAVFSMLVFAVTTARSESESSAPSNGTETTLVALPEFQVTAPEAPRPLELVLEVPVPRIERLIDEIETTRRLLVAREGRDSPKA